MIHPRWSAFRTGFAVDVVTLDIDGVPFWPLAKVRSGGFVDTIAIAQPVIFPVALTCNGGNTDAHDGTTYDWYLSQRTDEAPIQYLSFTQPDITRSGSVSLDYTLNVAKLVPSSELVAQLGEDALIKLFRHVTLYCQRKSDMAIQVVNMQPAVLGL